MKNLKLSKTLTQIALGNYYSEKALQAAFDHPALTEQEQRLVSRYLEGCKQSTDHMGLQEIAIRICESVLPKPKKLEHYKPLENPPAYPLELNDDLHICLWSEDGTYKWTIALWTKGKEGYSLEFVGARPLNERVKWKKLKAIIEQGQAIADKRFDAEQEFQNANHR